MTSKIHITLNSVRLNPTSFQSGCLGSYTIALQLVIALVYGEHISTMLSVLVLLSYVPQRIITLTNLQQQ